MEDRERDLAPKVGAERGGKTMSKFRGISMEMPGVWEAAAEYCKRQRDCGHIRDCKDYRDPDVRAPDGIVSYGQRIVSKNGSFRFGGETWQHDKLIPLAGFSTGVCMVDYWMSAVDIAWPRYPSGKIMFRLHSVPG